jgi:hypothetical protein
MAATVMAAVPAHATISTVGDPDGYSGYNYAVELSLVGLSETPSHAAYMAHTMASMAAGSLAGSSAPSRESRDRWGGSGIWISPAAYRVPVRIRAPRSVALIRSHRPGRLRDRPNQTPNPTNIHSGSNEVQVQPKQPARQPYSRRFSLPEIDQEFSEPG